MPNPKHKKLGQNTYTLGKISKTVTTAGTAVQVTSTQILVPWFYVQPIDCNCGDVFLGDSTVDNTWAAIPNTSCGISFSTNDLAEIGSGDQFDLSALYVDADNNGDGLIIQYPKVVT